jgi:hypothetical protein
MKKPDCCPEVYRMPPTKRFPKGLRVRKAVDQKYGTMGILVQALKDGHVFVTNEKLISERLA